MILLGIHILITAFLLGLSCFVLWVHYPAYRLVPKDVFAAYQSRHTGATVAITLPSMLVEMGTALLGFFWLPIDWLVQGIAFLPLLGVWYSTFVQAIPIHQRLLEQGKDEILINRLIQVHGWRTLWWFLHLLATLYLFARL
jgi:hypothetical protein